MYKIVFCAVYGCLLLFLTFLKMLCDAKSGWFYLFPQRLAAFPLKRTETKNWIRRTSLGETISTSSLCSLEDQATAAWWKQVWEHQSHHTPAGFSKSSDVKLDQKRWIKSNHPLDIWTNISPLCDKRYTKSMKWQQIYDTNKNIHLPSVPSVRTWRLTQDWVISLALLCHKQLLPITPGAASMHHLSMRVAGFVMFLSLICIEHLNVTHYFAWFLALFLSENSPTTSMIFLEYPNWRQVWFFSSNGSSVAVANVQRILPRPAAAQHDLSKLEEAVDSLERLMRWQNITKNMGFRVNFFPQKHAKTYEASHHFYIRLCRATKQVQTENGQLKTAQGVQAEFDRLHVLEKEEKLKEKGRNGDGWLCWDRRSWWSIDELWWIILNYCKKN